MQYGNRFLVLAILALVLAAGLTACGSKVNYLDNKDVKVEERHVKEDGRLVVYLSFKNSSSSDVNHSVYRVEWMDDDGNVLETTSWRPLIVKGGVTVRATERSTVPGVTDFQLQLSNDAS